MHRPRSICALLCLCLGWVVTAPTAAHAAISVVSSTEDVAYRALGTSVQGLTPTILGSSANALDPGNRTVIYVFQLPASDTGVNLVDQANFTFTVASALTTPTYNIDLYAIEARSNPVLQTGEFNNYGQPLVFTETAPSKLIKDNLLPAGQPFPVGDVSTDFLKGSDFVTFLNDQYGTDGSGIGKYLFLRLNADQVMGAVTSGGNVNMAESATGRPTLTLTFVPEPSTLLLAAPVGAAAALRRPRRAKV